MSRAFVKENDSAVETPVVRSVPQHPYLITPQGLKALRVRTEQAERDGTRDAADLREKLERATAVDPHSQPPGVVRFGASVEVEDQSGKRNTYTIVGEDEANPLQGTISWLSPLAQALDEARVGDRVIWQRPAGNVRLVVRAIRYASDDEK